MPRPYGPLPPAPDGWTLRDAFTVTKDEAGRYHIGQLSFADRTSYTDYFIHQRTMGGTPEQLAILHHVTTKGTIPFQEPVTPAPPGTTVDQLLNVQDKTPDAQGFYQLGSLRVHRDEHAMFSKLQRGLSERNPEALDLLYHMEHTPDQPLTFRISSSGYETAYDHSKRTLYWSPNLAVRDHANGARVASDTAALHEEAHWAAGDAGDVLLRIPAGVHGTLEEKRVIDGTEARDMRILGRPSRGSHYGQPFPVHRIDTVSGSIQIEQSGFKRYAPSPWSQHASVIEVGEMTTLAIRGNGTRERDRLKVNTEHLSYGMEGMENARALLNDARRNRDQIRVGITSDARVVYENSDQRERLELFHANMRYPNPSRNYEATVRAPAPQQQQQRTAVGR